MPIAQLMLILVNVITRRTAIDVKYKIYYFKYFHNFTSKVLFLSFLILIFFAKQGKIDV